MSRFQAIILDVFSKADPRIFRTPELRNYLFTSSISANGLVPSCLVLWRPQSMRTRTLPTSPGNQRISTFTRGCFSTVTRSPISHQSLQSRSTKVYMSTVSCKIDVTITDACQSSLAETSHHLTWGRESVKQYGIERGTTQRDL